MIVQLKTPECLKSQRKETLASRREDCCPRRAACPGQQSSRRLASVSFLCDFRHSGVFSCTIIHASSCPNYSAKLGLVGLNIRPSSFFAPPLRRTLFRRYACKGGNQAC